MSETWAESQHPDGLKGIGNDGLTAEERAAGVAPMFGPPIVIHGDTVCPGAGCDHPIHG